MENDILDSLNDLGYQGPLNDEVAFAKALNVGPKSLEFTKLIHILAEELKKLCRLEEAVSVMNDPDESSSFLLELSSFLKELGCPYKCLITGHMSSRLQSKEDRLLLLDYMISELMAARMVQVDCPKDKQSSAMEIVMQESPTAKDLKEILISLKFNKPPPNITAEMLFSKLEAKLKDTIQKEGDKLCGKPLYNKALTEKDWKNIETTYNEMFEEYSLRKETLITRLECTVQSFEWSDRLKTKKDTIQSVYRPKRETMKVKPHVKLSDFLAARTSLLQVEKTSSASVRKNTQSNVNKVIIGQKEKKKKNERETHLRVRREKDKLNDGYNVSNNHKDFNKNSSLKLKNKSHTHLNKSTKQTEHIEELKKTILSNQSKIPQKEVRVSLNTKESTIQTSSKTMKIQLDMPLTSPKESVLLSKETKMQTTVSTNCVYNSSTLEKFIKPKTSCVQPYSKENTGNKFKQLQTETNENPNIQIDNYKPSKKVEKKIEKEIARVTEKYHKIPQIVSKQLENASIEKSKTQQIKEENVDSSTQTECLNKPNDPDDEYKLKRKLEIQLEKEMYGLIYEQHLEGIIQLPGKQPRSKTMSKYENPDENVNPNSLPKKSDRIKPGFIENEMNNNESKTLDIVQNFQPVNTKPVVSQANNVASLYLKTPNVKQNLENSRKKSKKNRKNKLKEDIENDPKETYFSKDTKKEFDPNDNTLHIVILDKNRTHFDFYTYCLVVVMMNIAVSRYLLNPYKTESFRAPKFTKFPRFKHGGVRLHPEDVFTVKWVRETVEGLGILWQWSDGLEVVYETDLIKMRNRSKRSYRKRPC